jgi:hypothetical protein
MKEMPVPQALPRWARKRIAIARRASASPMQGAMTR